jgi:hypothetical protein
MEDSNTDEVGLAEALQMQILVNQALIDILIEKGIISQGELLEKVEQLKEELPKITIQ